MGLVIQGCRRKIPVQRYRCHFTGRTFSLLPDGLLPYHYLRALRILRELCAIFVDGQGVSTRARWTGIARTTLRHLACGFLRAVRSLRLPGHPGALAPKAFLTRLVALGPCAVRRLFRAWKEIEPKHSIVGIYAR